MLEETKAIEYSTVWTTDDYLPIILILVAESFVEQ